MSAEVINSKLVDLNFYKLRYKNFKFPKFYI